MKEYNVITASSIDELIQLVNEARSAKWEPTGGLTSWMTGVFINTPYLEVRNVEFAQAMVREKNAATIR